MAMSPTVGSHGRGNGWIRWHLFKSVLALFKQSPLAFRTWLYPIRALRRLHRGQSSISVLDSPSQLQTNTNPSLKSIHLFSAFFGDQFESLFLNSCLPSLLRDAEIQIFREIPTVLNIYCPSNQFSRISGRIHQILEDRELPIEVQHFELHIGVRTDFKKRALEMALYDQSLRAIESNSLVIVAVPDTVFGNGISGLIRTIEYGQLIVAAQARIDQNAAISHFSDNPLFLSESTNSQLVESCANQLSHNILAIAKERGNDYLSIEEECDHFICFFKEPPPVMFWGSWDLVLQTLNTPPRFSGLWEMLDHELPERFADNHQLIAVADSRVFFWAEITPHTKYSELGTNHWWSSAAIGLSRLAVKWHRED